jgi:cyclophilin family peptidyl-prolyl cis-trans isomerase
MTMSGLGRRLPAFLWFVLTIAAAGQSPSDVEAVVLTDAGSFRIQFFPDKAPKHVQEFLSSARKGVYDGTAFFRMVANGVIQGGDPAMKSPETPRSRWGTGGFEAAIPAELSDAKHQRGSISSVHLQNKAGSDGSQFFVCVSPQPALDSKYTVFGQVLEGMEVVEQISRTPVDAQGLAQTPVHILKISIQPSRQEPYAHASIEELRKTVRLETTLGVIRIQTQPDWAPLAVQRFLMLSGTGWYNHTAFHRLVKGFVIQGGTAETRAGTTTNPADRWIQPLKAEFRTDLKHERGIVSMAHGDDPNSATTSFFIVLGPAPHLDGKFSAFGKVVEGLDVLDAFEKEDVDGETPKRRLEISSVTVE